MKMSGRTYDILKNLAQIWLPALGTLYFALAAVWGWPDADKVTGSVIAVDAFLGVILGISSATYSTTLDKNRIPYAGTIVVDDDNPEKTMYSLDGVELDALKPGEDVTFKVIPKQ